MGSKSTDNSVKAIPITVFTGFLGAGKTTIILSLLPRLPKDYKVVLLKNEFGDVEVDSKLAESSNLTAVSEILNGCMCCVLVGQMQTALLEIRETFNPDRIIIECSGSAFPATLAFQIRQLEKDTGGAFKLDAIVTVVDAENFAGYEDTSPTARMQASYSDLIVINKWEHVTDRGLDIVMDHLHTLNDLTPKVKCEGRSGVDPSLVFGLDSQLFLLEERDGNQPHHHHHGRGDHHSEVQTLTLVSAAPLSLSHSTVEQALRDVSKETVYRIKGFICLSTDPAPSAAVDSDSVPGSESRDIDAGRLVILNWAFGRWDLTPYRPGPASSSLASTTLEANGAGAFMMGSTVRLTVMGERGSSLRFAAREIAVALGGTIVEG